MAEMASNRIVQEDRGALILLAYKENKWFSYVPLCLDLFFIINFLLITIEE